MLVLTELYDDAVYPRMRIMRFGFGELGTCDANPQVSPMSYWTRKFLALRARAIKGRPIGNNQMPTTGTDQVAFNRGHHVEVQALDTVWTPFLVHRSPEPLNTSRSEHTDSLDSIGSDG